MGSWPYIGSVLYKANQALEALNTKLKLFKYPGKALKAIVIILDEIRADMQKMSFKYVCFIVHMHTAFFSPYLNHSFYHPMNNTGPRTTVQL